MGQFPMANWPIGFLAVHVLATSAQLGESHQATSLAPISWDRDAKRHLRKRRRRGSPKSALILRILSSFLPMCHGQNIKKKVLVIHKQKNVNQSINQCVLIDVFFQTLILENHQAIFFQTCFFQTLISNHWFLVLMAMGIQTTFHGHRAASQLASFNPWSLPR